MTDGPTASMTTSAWPSRKLMTAMTWSSTSRFSGPVTTSMIWASPRRISGSRLMTGLSPASPPSEGSSPSSSASSPLTWSRSQGAAANWMRWVDSWSATHRRKSRGETPSVASVCAIVGATRSSRPEPAGWGPPPNGSNCPRTRVDRTDSTAAISRVFGMRPASIAARMSSDSAVPTIAVSDCPDAFAQARRSTTSTGPEAARTRTASACSWSSRMTSRTRSTEVSAASRSCATTAAVSFCGRTGPPGTTSRTVRSRSVRSRMSAPSPSIRPSCPMWARGSWETLTCSAHADHGREAAGPREVGDGVTEGRPAQGQPHCAMFASASSNA